MGFWSSERCSQESSDPEHPMKADDSARTNRRHDSRQRLFLKEFPTAGANVCFVRMCQPLHDLIYISNSIGVRQASNI